ncbi:hypothetical protein [Couchioplanes caeruleus]|uniref:Uncharacterized protein n=2 Tax=Couchioplanes caeruleus TaxID=56438 RepID=A0A1K0GEW9_9ACTN|nr:hypothetical protein [Couchioplanes caeruleus]OJF15786.1 hypothetical protein BG844_02400 [Couchioplanes caeruleus subsp. caeruleus]ROP33051.1 hypothetical protein EDD30_6020 [Couchioplanes caeruleus]
MSADSVADVKREILVRHLEAWAPAALHRARRAVYAHGYADATRPLAEAALGVFTEQSDLVRGRELAMVAVGGEIGGTGGAGLSVLGVPGRTEDSWGAALKAAGASRVPVLGFLDATAVSEPPGAAMLTALAAGKPAEVIVVVPGSSPVPQARDDLRQAGFPLVAAVELAVSDEPGEILLYATTLGKSLEAFKDLLWAVDEYAGVRYRDPGDPERHLIDISLSPHPGPLRRELLAHLREEGEASVTNLRTFALTETVYRAADATRVLHTLLDAGTVTRRPEHGRLGGDVIISA